MLRAWDLSGRNTYLQQSTQVGDSEVFEQADISPDGQRVAYRWLDDAGKGWVRFVDTVTGDATPPTGLPVTEAEPSVARWPLGTWHHEGRQYASSPTGLHPGRATGVVTVLDSATGKRYRRDVIDGDGPVDSIRTLAYVDGGRSLLVGKNDFKTLSIVDAETLRPRGDPFDIVAHCCATPIGNGSAAMVYEFSADFESTHWRIIDVDTGDVRSEGDLDLSAMATVASPDGSAVAVAGYLGEIVTIDVATGDEQRLSTGLGAQVLWLNYSDDGELLVSGAADGGVSLWDATTLDLLGTVYPPHRGEPVPAGAQFIGDSHDVAIASYDGGVYRWETDVDRSIDFACQMAGRNMTEEEWVEFLPAQPYQSVCPQE
jgi:WD40 repeat protein